MLKKFKDIKKVHIIGIKGSGVVGIAEILKKKGVEVIGSDTKEKFFTDNILKKNGINVIENFDIKNITPDIDLIIYSTAYNENNNVEFQKAKRLKIPMFSYPEILGELFNEKYGLAVCGTHGKTTTSALLAHTLQECDKNPSAVIGSRVKNWPGSTLSGEGEYFIIEADEYQNKFKYYNPKGAILTNLDFDHPDYFKNFEEYKKAFSDFVLKISKVGFLVVWGDSVDTLEVAKSCKGKVLTYGFGENDDFQISNYKIQNSNKSQIINDKNSKSHEEFEIFFRGKSLGCFKTQLVGKHNVLNACAVISICHNLGIDLEKVEKALKTFQGTSRRFEYVGKRKGAILIDDYAHHPEELKATLKAAKEKHPDRKIWAIFHPHSYSRTKSFFQEFAQSFSSAEKVIVLDIYGSARESEGDVSSEKLVGLINKYEPNKAEYISTIPETVKFLKDKIGKNDIVITIGAGNVFEVAHQLKED